MERPEALLRKALRVAQRSANRRVGKARYSSVPELERAVLAWAFEQRRDPRASSWTRDQASFMRELDTRELRALATPRDADDEATTALDIWGPLFRALVVFSNAEHRLASRYRDAEISGQAHALARALVTWDALNALDDNPPRKRRGRPGNGPLAGLVRSLRGTGRPTKAEVDRLTAAAIIAGLLDVDALRSLVTQAEHRRRPFPSLNDGVETMRKRVRLALSSQGTHERGAR